MLGEPPGLAKYRADNPKEDTSAPSEASRVWTRFRNEGQLAYAELRKQLLERQQGLCGYCEQRLTALDGRLVLLDQQVEHVRAKSKGSGRTLDWTNFLVCCAGGTQAQNADSSRFSPGPNESCGQKKDEDDLPPGCDPRGFPVGASLLDIDIDGRIAPSTEACRAAGVDPEDLARATNEVLGLNCDRLRTARRRVGDNIRSWLVPILETLIAGSHLGAPQRRQMRDLLAEARLAPDQHGYLRAFWSTERQGLGTLADSWIAENMSRLNW